MILNRLGNKTRIAKDIIKYFPHHRTYIDMFFGAGGIYFNKTRADYNFCNDFDDDIFNLFMCLSNNKEELIKAIEIMPISESLMKYWNKNIETEPIKKAIRFLLLSNFGFIGQPDTMLFVAGNGKKIILSKIENCFEAIKFAQFMCCDFRDVLKKVRFRIDTEKNNSFIYADPPYLSTGSNYKNGFTQNDTIDLFDILVNSGIRFALSEFDNPFILDLAKDLNVITIGERQNMKNRRIEILVTNYELPLTLF